MSEILFYLRDSRSRTKRAHCWIWSARSVGCLANAELERGMKMTEQN